MIFPRFDIELLLMLAAISMMIFKPRIEIRHNWRGRS